METKSLKSDSQGIAGEELSDNIIKQVEKHNDPMMCIARIDWRKVKTGRAANDLEQGRLLAKQIFKNIDWSQVESTSASILSRVLKEMPEDRKYEQVVQGFTDGLTHALLKAASAKG